MKGILRILGLLLASALVVLAPLSASAAPHGTVDVSTLPNVKKIMELSPEQVKELHQEAMTSGDVGINGVVGVGLWLGGTWVDVLDTQFDANDTGQTPLEEFLRLGAGRCTTDEVTTNVTLTIKGTVGSNYQSAINKSFEFSASGSRTWTKKEQYCGPNEANKTRIFYKHGVFNDYKATVIRMYSDWDGWPVKMETRDSRTVQVPHPSYPTRDI